MFDRRGTRWTHLILLFILIAVPVLAEKSASEADAPFGFLAATEKVYQSQLFVQPDGSLLMVWTQAGETDLDLFVASQNSADVFSRPIRINRTPVNGYTGDEARPAVAFGTDGRIAVAWTAADGDIMAATGVTDGLVFAAPVKLNQDENKTYRTMPAITYTSDGVAHVVWIDGRDAPKGMEEPANIYYARVMDGRAKETNLTAGQEASVCGCCRPYIGTSAAGSLEIAFRNTSDAGYRDISYITGDAKGDFSTPQPTSPPIWKLQGCPMSGPIRYDEGTLWRDASTGSWRLLWSTAAEQEPANLFSDRDDLNMTRPPRSVNGAEGWVLMGGKPNSFIIAKQDSEWKIVREGLPEWASSAVLTDDTLILVGNVKGRFHAETLDISAE
jgi:hypothetical protein